MKLLLTNLGDIGSLLLWVGLWTLGGWWIVRNAFNLRTNEQAMAGFGLGLVLENWIANLLGMTLPVMTAFWLAAGLVLIIGVGFSLPLRRENLRSRLYIPILPLQWGVLIILVFILMSVGRGLAILDDYQNLPITSLIATGDIPPHFALDPTVNFNYHYFTLLFAAQLMRIGDFFVWNALDLARGLSFAVALMLAGLWAQRVTRSALAGVLCGMMTAFAGGTRWLMLLLPVSVLKRISPHIHMIGTGAQTASDFLTAMTGPWAIESGASWSFPFAYVNGMNPVSVWTYHAGASSVGIGSFLLLTHNRWRDWRGGVITAAVLAAGALIFETSIVQLGIGMLFITVIYILMRKSIRVPKSLTKWLLVLIPAGLVVAFQGGVLSGIVSDWLTKITGAQAGGGSYFSFDFSLLWPPAVLSSHLGFLSLANPYQLLTAIFEIGPIILLLPLPLIWGMRAFRYGRWYEAAVIVMPILSLFTLIVQYTGSAGPTALNRVQSMIIGISSGAFAIPALWLWVSHRSERAKALVAVFLFLTMFGGMVLFGFELLAVPKPFFSTFITGLDARMERHYWDRLEPDALIFDPIASRSPTIFGRPTDSHITWYEEKPEWAELVEFPNPIDLKAAGFDYAYIDYRYWDQLDPEYQQMLQAPCVHLVEEYKEKRTHEFRRLLDIRECQPIRESD